MFDFLFYLYVQLGLADPALGVSALCVFISLILMVVDQVFYLTSKRCLLPKWARWCLFWVSFISISILAYVI